MSVKPILIVKLPSTYDINPESFEGIIKNVETRTGQEYYVLPVIEYQRKELDFQVFFEKDFSEVKYEELKSLLIESIANLADAS